MNIWSGSQDPLGAALTNPTTWSRRKGGIQRDYPVTVDGVTFPDAEAAYKAAQRRPGDVEAMIPIIALKFQRHEQLVRWVEARGGREWLLLCSHMVGARRVLGGNRPRVALHPGARGRMGGTPTEGLTRLPPVASWHDLTWIPK